MEKYSGEEKRRSERLNRPFVLAFRRASEPQVPMKIQQLRNISEGGIAFRSEEEFNPGEVLELFIRVPTVNQAISAKGRVAGSCRISRDIFCETRVVFTEISEEAKKRIKDSIEQFKKQKKE